MTLENKDGSRCSWILFLVLRCCHAVQLINKLLENILPDIIYFRMNKKLNWNEKDSYQSIGFQIMQMDFRNWKASIICSFSNSNDSPSSPSRIWYWVFSPISKLSNPITKSKWVIDIELMTSNNFIYSLSYFSNYSTQAIVYSTSFLL